MYNTGLTACRRIRNPMLLLGTQRVNELGHLEVGGCDTVDLAQKFGTPLYVLDEADFRGKMRAYRNAFEQRYPRNEIAYASKALLCMAVARLVAEEGFHMDVASAGELYTAVKSGFPGDRLVLHGNNKSQLEVSMALEMGVGRVVVDNLNELNMLEAEAAAKGTVAPILLRVTPGIDPHTHKFISTGQEDTKFGLNITTGAAMEGIKKALEFEHIKLIGVHCHVGSQLLDTEAHEGAIDRMIGFMDDVRTETGVVLDELNIGGGLGIRYLEEHNPPSIEDYAEVICNTLKAALDSHNFPYPKLLQEPGRSIIGEAGLTLYTIGAIKEVPIVEEPGVKIYATTNGGLSDNPRPQLYDAVYTPLLANRMNEPHDQQITIAGKHCETDTLITNTLLPKPNTGDILAVLSTGAYNFAMASNYNRFRRPAMVLVVDGHADIIVERQNLDDLLWQDRIPERLKPNYE